MLKKMLRKLCCVEEEKLTEMEVYFQRFRESSKKIESFFEEIEEARDNCEYIREEIEEDIRDLTILKSKCLKTEQRCTKIVGTK